MLASCQFIVETIFTRYEFTEILCICVLISITLPNKLMHHENANKKGIAIVTPNVIGVTINLRGLIDRVLRALIWSDIFIVAISAAKEEPSLPEIIKPVITGQSSLTMDSDTTLARESTLAKDPRPE